MKTLSWTNRSHMVHSEVLCPNLLSLVYADGYVSDICIYLLLEMCHHEGDWLK